MSSDTDRALAVIGWKVIGILGVPLLGMVFFFGILSNRVSQVEKQAEALGSVPVQLTRIETILSTVIKNHEERLVRAELQLNQRVREGGDK